MLRIYLILIITGGVLVSCSRNELGKVTRDMVDSVGFATKAWQMDSVMKRIERRKGSGPVEQRVNHPWKTAIAPHDDYSYAGPVYTRVLPNIEANTLILIGVAHQAADFGLKEHLIFEDFDYWDAPYGKIKTSGLREKILQHLPEDTYRIHRKMHQKEHSLEALLPFLQYYHKEKIEIIPLLVPYMKYSTMQEIAPAFAEAVKKAAGQKQYGWGKDFALIISTDAVHYGDKDWGGKDYASYGTDSAGYRKAVQHEYKLIDQSFRGELKPEKAAAFYRATISDSDYTRYKWTWCGRYSVPFGLLASYHLNREFSASPLQGAFLDYSTSIDHHPIPVEDLEMGQTAPAHLSHWVGYTAAGFR